MVDDILERHASPLRLLSPGEEGDWGKNLWLIKKDSRKRIIRPKARAYNRVQLSIVTGNQRKRDPDAYAPSTRLDAGKTPSGTHRQPRTQHSQPCKSLLQDSGSVTGKAIERHSWPASPVRPRQPRWVRGEHAKGGERIHYHYVLMEFEVRELRVFWHQFDQRENHED